MMFYWLDHRHFYRFVADVLDNVKGGYAEFHNVAAKVRKLAERKHTEEKKQAALLAVNNAFQKLGELERWHITNDSAATILSSVSYMVAYDSGAYDRALYVALRRFAPEATIQAEAYWRFVDAVACEPTAEERTAMEAVILTDNLDAAYNLASELRPGAKASVYPLP
jgi:hypothetical protein